MPRKCDDCRYFSFNAAIGERCHQGEIRRRADQDFVVFPGYTELTPAREICNKEGDGIFAYVAPKDPKAGAAFVQVEKTMRAAA